MKTYVSSVMQVNAGMVSAACLACRRNGRKEGTRLFDINTKHSTEIYIGKIISGDSH